MVRPVAIIFALLIIAAAFQFDVVRVSGSSMSSTYCDGDLLLSRRVGTLGYNPNELAQKVIVARAPSSSVIKRVVAEPGDKVAIRAGRLERNGEIQLEPYVCDGAVNPSANWPARPDGYGEVPEGYWFLLGDSRADSFDSADFGPAPIGAVKSVVIARIRRGSGSCTC